MVQRPNPERSSKDSPTLKHCEEMRKNLFKTRNIALFSADPRFQGASPAHEHKK
jgi:hypothetical protein